MIGFYQFIDIILYDLEYALEMDRGTCFETLETCATIMRCNYSISGKILGQSLQLIMERCSQSSDNNLNLAWNIYLAGFAIGSRYIQDYEKAYSF